MLADFGACRVCDAGSITVSILREIQSSLMQEGTGIGLILLKLRFLASRLGSDLFEEWVRHETEGYPGSAPVPDYRKVEISYTASFSGVGGRIKNAPIPPHLVKKIAGDRWVTYEIRQSIAAVDDMVRFAGQSDSSFGIDASDLMLLLQGKIYPGMTCNSVTSSFSTTAFVEVQFSVRTRVLELTIELEKSVPAAAEITIGPQPSALSVKDSNRVTHITNQVVHGNYTEISSSGANAQFLFNIGERDSNSLTRALVEGGIPEADAAKLVDIVSTEEPESQESPLGVRAKDWLSKNIGKAVNGTWKIGLSAAEELLTEAALRYYGLK